MFLTGARAEYLYLQENESAYRAATVPFQQLDRQVNRGGCYKIQPLVLPGSVHEVVGVSAADCLIHAEYLRYSYSEANVLLPG